MKKINNLFATLITGMSVAGLALNFNACTEQSPMQPAKDANHFSTSTLAKVNSDNYPQINSRKVNFWGGKGMYRGTSMPIPNGSTFGFSVGALTPPADVPVGEPVTISMQADMNTAANEIIFTFGPSGCQFHPPAQLKFDWHDLNSKSATLYYIDENGNYIQQTPDEMDLRGKWMKLYISHFSRYALAAE